MTPSEATRAHTQLAVAWLWHARGARVIAREVGVSSSALGLDHAQGCWRADVVGISAPTRLLCARGVGGEPPAPYRRVVNVVEVKGHRRDWLRERACTTVKWRAGSDHGLALWLLVSADIGDDVLVNLPRPWGILRADAKAESLEVVRRPLSKGLLEGDRAFRALDYCARALTCAPLPSMGVSRPVARDRDRA